ncbi:MAG: T9SS type A sorting domain-containing protein [bacterium]
MRKLILGLVLLAFPSFLLGTPYVSPEHAAEQPDISARGRIASPFDSDYDPLIRFGMCADFITTLQVLDPNSPDYGGMREGEHMLGVIQTDNTSESIWIWSHYFDLTGQDLYHSNIDAAWQYCMNFPAYDEEGGTSPVSGYYRVYNCSWAVRAAMEYERIYGDDQYRQYADSCASYLCHNPLVLRYPVGMYRRLNGLIMGWAVGNLYEYGEFVENSIFRLKAVEMADSLKGWIEVKPERLGWEEWAMNGGSMMWGLVNSYFKHYPESLEIWVENYAPYLDTEIDSSTYQNAWRAWAALGQSVAGEVLRSPTYAGYFKHLADTLVANDGDNDGGIPVIDGEPDDHDQSWVTNYLGFMCMDRLLETADIVWKPTAQGFSINVAGCPSLGLPEIYFELAKPSALSLAVFDVRGRVLSNSNIGEFTSGLHVLSLGDFVQRQISPGVYFIELRSTDSIARNKVVVLGFKR